MDPDQGYRDWRDAVEAGDKARAVTAAVALLDWMALGGARPKWTTEQAMAFGLYTAQDVVFAKVISSILTQAQVEATVDDAS